MNTETTLTHACHRLTLSPVPSGKSPNVSLNTRIVEGNFLECFLGMFNSINDFYLNLVANWDSLEEKQQQLQVACPKTGGKVRWPRPGLWVAAAVYKDGERHRAKILARVMGSLGTWRVRLIDFGDVLDVHESKMYTLPSEYIRFDAQAIHCRLAMKNNLSLDDLKMTSKYFFKEAFNQNLAVHFFEFNEKQRIWDVHVGVLKTKEIQIPVGLSSECKIKRRKEIQDLMKDIYGQFHPTTPANSSSGESRSSDSGAGTL